MTIKTDAKSLLAATAIMVAFSGTAYAEVAPSAVINHYADIAQAKYEDSLKTATLLGDAIEAFLAAPSQAGLQTVRQAWLAARVPYQQTEVYRFGNAIVDDWEGRVNAWPLG
jgi:putative iron-regulated protein